MLVSNAMKEQALGFGGLEFATFRLREGIGEDALLAACDKVDREFLQTETGIFGHLLLKGADGVYADVTFADTQARAQQVCAKWLEQAVALEYIALFDEQSVNMTFWERLR
ncbi:hypothetical protein CR105_25405 [Massilia eurypsychrophila]|jgi:hypothetical protein|uniref:DUF4242 domain-containing protein n=1 Tax=Massilia eurypsychrophila TaxID=1485217 RepID=A0A2G8T826_9BURK|nr:hypothetical protein [Massilia eurypsychrophila]PIL42210.1 hypothetical protein CR105_25405 [Massilia eurypsychrophila]